MDRGLKAGVVRELSRSEVYELAASHRAARRARYLAGFEYADTSAARRAKLANELRHGHTVVGPLYPSWGGVINLVIMDAWVERRERQARAGG